MVDLLSDLISYLIFHVNVISTQRIALLFSIIQLSLIIYNLIWNIFKNYEVLCKTKKSEQRRSWTKLISNSNLIKVISCAGNMTVFIVFGRPLTCFALSRSSTPGAANFHRCQTNGLLLQSYTFRWWRKRFACFSSVCPLFSKTAA